MDILEAYFMHAEILGSQVGGFLGVTIAGITLVTLGFGAMLFGIVGLNLLWDRIKGGD